MMERKDIRVCILRIEGTNCEEEAAQAFRMHGVNAEIVHLKDLIRKGDLLDYQALMIPGGFSAGDYVRAGAILGARIKSSIGKDLERFVEEGRPVIGVCNGFQVLVELGILPGFQGTMTDQPEAALSTNDSGRFECRPSLLEHVQGNPCIFTKHLTNETVLIPSAHAEGKLTFPSEREGELLDLLKERNQIVFRYVGPEGERSYPWNPNGSIHDIAGICNARGNVLGMMPHPERVLYSNRLPDWTRKEEKPAGPDIFESAILYIEGSS